MQTPAWLQKAGIFSRDREGTESIQTWLSPWSCYVDLGIVFFGGNNFPATGGFKAFRSGFFFFRSEATVLQMPESELERRLLWRPTIQPKAFAAKRAEIDLKKRPEQAVPIKQRLQSARNLPQRWSPDLLRARSAGRLLFQVVGIAGYAGYFASMHTLMRVFSSVLLAGAWYAIYRVKRPPQV